MRHIFKTLVFLVLFCSTLNAAQQAYVPNTLSNNVSVIDTDTNTVVATVAVGTNPTGVAIAERTGPNAGIFAYVANDGDNNVSVIDTATNTVVTIVAVGSGPLGVAIAERTGFNAGIFAYVANTDANTVSVIDTATNLVVDTISVGTNPVLIAFAELTDPLKPGIFAYLTNRGDNTVNVIDTATNTVVATVPVGSGPSSVAIAERTGPNAGIFAYVTNEGSNTVSVIDTATNTVVTTVVVGTHPSGVAIAERTGPNAGIFAYVPNNGNGENNVSVIDTATNTVVATVAVGTTPVLVAIAERTGSNAGIFAYVPNSGDNTVSVIDTATNTVVDTIAVGSLPEAVAIANAPPIIQRGYVVNSGSNTVNVVDTATNTIVGTVAVGVQPVNVAIAERTGPNAGIFAYVTNNLSDNVNVINTAFNTVVATIPVGIFPNGVAIAERTGPNAGIFAYVTNVTDNTVSVIDTASNAVVTTVAVGTNPFDVAIAERTGPNAGIFAYVTNDGSSNVSIIDTTSNTVVATVAVGTQPQGLAIAELADPLMPGIPGIFAYVTNVGDNTVSVIDTDSYTVVATIAVGTSPMNVAIAEIADPLMPGIPGIFAYIVNLNSDNVSVIDTASNMVVATVTVGTAPFGVAIAERTGPNAGIFAYVTNTDDNTVSVIDTATNTVVDTLPGFVTPNGVAIANITLPGNCDRPYIYQVLFVNNCNTSPVMMPFGSGTYDDPYNNLFYALNKSNPCDVIYVFPGNSPPGMTPYDASAEAAAASLIPGPYTLKDNQRLLGTTTQAFPFPCSDCNKPTLTFTTLLEGSPVVQLSDSNNNEVSGFNIITASGGSVQYGIQSGVASMLVGQPQITLTNNTITISGSGSIAVTADGGAIGGLIVSNCQFVATDNNSETAGIAIGGTSATGTIEITNNTFSGMDSSTGFKSGIAFTSSFGSYNLYIANNTFSSFNTNGLTGIVFLNYATLSGDGVSTNALITGNIINIPIGSKPTAGISIRNGLPSEFPPATICLTLNNNVVSTPSSIPGYLLWNSAFDGAFSFSDYGNVGTFDINKDNTFYHPVTYTYGCPEFVITTP